ncbi:hypothetical protein BDN71DRAFT_1498295 [Pleurotus eryngii]|uniref:Uncharacterized protein n=1 Tax=Pleurotus eryngii TaxID=5323 RepID=A0A9P5ZQL8_PLEER|nr:hypothetical protein BDN71DRAFT_1498295 [Pleurotus eryngii]
MATMLYNEVPDATQETQQIIQIDPVESLAENTSTVVSHLYSLHAVLGTLGDASFNHVQLLSVTKKELGQQWEAWLEFFRECLGHLRTCRRLYEVLQSGEISQVQAIASSTLSIAASITKRASRLPVSYKETLSLLLAKAQEASNSRHPGRSQESTVSQGRVPNVMHEFTSLLGALQSSVKCLEGIASYWAKHHATLHAISEAELSVNTLLTTEETTVRMWTKYHDIVRQAASDITTNCDALTVDPPIRMKSKKLRKMLTVASAIKPELPPKFLMPPPLQPPRQGECMLFSKEQFDVPSVSRASTLVAHCLQKLYDDKSVPGQYIQTFQCVVEVAEAGKVFYLNAGNLRVRGTREAMHESAARARTTLDKALALWHESDARNLEAGHGCGSTDLEGRKTKLNVEDNDPHTREAVESLVEKLRGFLVFWNGMTLELNESHIQDLLRDDHVKLPTNVWNLQVSHYRECIKEIRQVQSLLVRAGASDDKITSLGTKRRSMNILIHLIRLFCVLPKGSREVSYEEASYSPDGKDCDLNSSA